MLLIYESVTWNDLNWVSLCPSVPGSVSMIIACFQDLGRRSSGLARSLGSNYGRGWDVYLYSVHTDCWAAHTLIQWYLTAISSLIMRSELEAGQSFSFSAEVKRRTCTSAPPVCVQDVHMDSFTFWRRLAETAVFYRMFPTKLTSLVLRRSVFCWSLNCLKILLIRLR